MNYMRIFSKSSLVSSSSVAAPSEEISKLLNEIDVLRQTVEALKITVESRDAAIGTLAREKEKFYIELKTAQRTNRNLHQQLEDERDIHSKEKDFLIEEIKRVSMRSERPHIENKYERCMNHKLFEELKTKDEVICNICAKYMKIKGTKMILLDELKNLQTRSQKVCDDVIILLQKNKKYLDDLLGKIIEYCTVPPNSKVYLKMLQINASLYYENTQLKVCLASPVSDNFLRSGHVYENVIQNEKLGIFSCLQNKVKVAQNSLHRNNMEHKKNKEFISLDCDNNVISTNLEHTIYKSHSDSHLHIITSKSH